MSWKKKRLKRFRAAKNPDWTGINIVSWKVGRDDSVYVHKGLHYCTIGELQVAQLLDKMGIAFTPNVSFEVRPGGTLKHANKVVPDFVFNGDEYVWTEDDGTEIVIHGIECKATNRKPERLNLLYEQRGIHILVMSDAEIDQCTEDGSLPLILLRRKDE